MGYRINPREASIADDWVEAFRNVPVAIASDCLGRSVGGLGLHAYHGSIEKTLCGRALTVRVRPGDNLMLHKALSMAQPGDVIIVDGSGDLTQALIGGLMRATAIQRQLGGFVVDGAIRDLVEWADGAMPVFARGFTHRGPSKDGPGEINVPIACAGMAVQAGDLVIGDADGVLAIPAAELPALHALCVKKMAMEDRIRAQNVSGNTDFALFDELLRKKGVPI
jgi:regulator of RNase E activity RraA